MSWLLACSASCAALACSSKEGASKDDEPAAAEVDVEAIGYPVGPYWTDERIASVLLSASHILISHRGAASGDASSEPRSFLTAIEPAARDRDAALRRARELQSKLRRDPAQFEQLARKESDDRGTAPLGGSLGYFYPHNVPSSIVDALAHLKSGEISRIVETPQGFHLLRRDRVGSDTPVVLAQIVIKPSGANGWRRSDRPPPERTRAQARELAQQVAAQAKDSPAEWDSLVERYSDAEDATRGGYMGARSRYEPAYDFVLLEIGARLPAGSVSGVFETQNGFHVLKRVEPRQPDAVAASVITLAHSASQFQRFDSERRRPRATAERLARELIAELTRHPERFDALRAERCEVAYCGSEPHAWPRGRAPAAIERTLLSMRVGEISHEPIDAPQGFAVLRKEDATVHRPRAVPQPLFDVPWSFAQAAAEPSPLSGSPQTHARSGRQ